MFLTKISLKQCRQHYLKKSIEFLQLFYPQLNTCTHKTQETVQIIPSSVSSCFISNSLDTIRTSRHSQTSLHLHVFRMHFQSRMCSGSSPYKHPQNGSEESDSILSPSHLFEAVPKHSDYAVSWPINQVKTLLSDNGAMLRADLSEKTQPPLFQTRSFSLLHAGGFCVKLCIKT